MKKRILALVLFLVVSVSATFPVFAEEKYKDEYKLSVNISETTPQGKAIARFAKLVKERTDGKINIKVYWNGQLFSGKATNELLLMRKNVGDFSLSSFINWAPQFPQGNLFLLPWFISQMPDKYKALDAVENGTAGRMLKDKIAKMGLLVLAWGEQGARELTNNLRPVRTPEDIKDIKFRTIGSPLFLDIFKTLGANPMNISFAEALTALQQNTVDGQENPYSVIIPFKIYEFQKYLTEWSYTMDPLIYVVHEDVWNSFPEDIRQIVSETAQECGQYNKALARLGLDDGSSATWLEKHGLFPEEADKADPRSFLAEQGIEVTILSPEEIGAFRTQMEPVYEKWVKKVGKKLVDAAEQDMNQIQY